MLLATPPKPTIQNRDNVCFMKIILIFCLFAIFLLFSSATPPTGGCTQEFRFFFKSQHDEAFWIGENRYGECGESHLIQVFLNQQGTPHQTKFTELKEFDNWHWVETAQEKVKTEEVIAIKSYDGHINFPITDISLTAPPPNQPLQYQRQEKYRNDCAKNWNSNMGKEGIDMPIFKGIKPELLYYYKDGIYFNYTVEEAYLFPISRYLLVFTKSEQKCSGDNTMHGFMLFKFEVSK